MWNSVTSILYKLRHVYPFSIASRTSNTQNDDYAKCAERDMVHLGNSVDKTENKATQG